MSDHYPPGVTGREPEIAGYPERTERVECLSETTGYYRREVLDLIDLTMNTREGPTAEGLQRLRAALDGLEECETECNWEGEISGWPNGYDFEWTCPRCGNEQVEEGLYEPDPDEQRDW